MAKYNIRVGLRDGSVMDVEKYELEKYKFYGADSKVYELEDIHYFIVLADELKKITEKNNEPSAKKSKKREANT